MLMWCSVGWWIVPWPRQPELEHWIQVLRNLGTSMLANLFKLLSGFQEQAELQLFHHMPLLEFTEDQVWLQRRDHSLEQEGEWLPFGAACSYPRVEWLGNRIIEKGKSSYTSGLASGSPLVTDIWFLTNREPKSLHFPPTPAFRPPASLSVYRDQQGNHIRIWGLGVFLKKMQLHVSLTPSSAMMSSLYFFLRTCHFIVTCMHLYIHDLSYYKKIQKSQQVW